MFQNLWCTGVIFSGNIEISAEISTYLIIDASSTAIHMNEVPTIDMIVLWLGYTLNTLRLGSLTSAGTRSFTTTIT